MQIASALPDEADFAPPAQRSVAPREPAQPKLQLRERTYDATPQQRYSTAAYTAAAEPSAARPAFATSSYGSSSLHASSAKVQPSLSPIASSLSGPNNEPSSLLPPPLPTSIDSSALPEVHAFLKSLYPGSASTPACELTPYTVDALQRLAAYVHASDERAALLEEDMLEAAREYDSETHRLGAALERMGLNAEPQSQQQLQQRQPQHEQNGLLTPQAHQHLHTLASTAQLLALKDVDPTTSAHKGFASLGGA